MQAGGPNAPRLDDMDRRIIEQLQEDGRRSYGRIGSAVGLSEAAARQRVQRLLDADVIKIVAVVDPDTFGFRMRATVGLLVEGDLMRAADRVAEIPEVDYVVITTGSFDLLIEIQCEDNAHLFTLLNERIRVVPGVRRAETFTYLRVHKQTYPWPPI